MTANVITYRGRSGRGKSARPWDLPADTIERLSQLVSNWESRIRATACFAHLGEPAAIPGSRASSTSPGSGSGIQDLPRHLGQHSGAW